MFFLRVKTTAITFNPLTNTFENALTGANININDLVTNLGTANITITTASLLPEDGTISINDSIIYTADSNGYATQAIENQSLGLIFRSTLNKVC
jgi:hypothetical protein